VREQKGILSHSQNSIQYKEAYNSCLLFLFCLILIDMDFVGVVIFGGITLLLGHVLWRWLFFVAGKTRLTRGDMVCLEIRMQRKDSDMDHKRETITDAKGHIALME
jgi:hypothetical protein